MGLWKKLAKVGIRVGATVAAPYTGGASLAAIPISEQLLKEDKDDAVDTLSTRQTRKDPISSIVDNTAGEDLKERVEKDMAEQKRKRVARMLARRGATETLSYEHGGVVKKTGLARVHKGEVVLTAGKAKKMLDDGAVRGRALTDKQRKFFGHVASGVSKDREGRAARMLSRRG